jgi:hypothetical protein
MYRLLILVILLCLEFDGKRFGRSVGFGTSENRAADRQVEGIGWGGRIRTFTVLINSEVSYQLDHAPAVGQSDGNACRAARLWSRVCRVTLADRRARHRVL